MLPELEQALTGFLGNLPTVEGSGVGEVPPVISYRFAALLFTGLVPQGLDIRFQEISGLEVKRNLNTEQEWGLLQPKVDFRTLTLKRGVMAGPTVLGLTHLVETFPDFWNQRLLETWILIAVLSDNYVPLNAWVVGNAYLDSVQWDPLNATNNQVLIETMSYKYSKLQHIPL